MASSFVKSNFFERYKNEFVLDTDLQLDPKLVDNKYAKTQSFLDRSINDIKAGSANLGTMAVLTFLALPDIIGNIANNRTASDSPLVQGLADWRKSVEENNVNYNTEVDDTTTAWGTIRNVLLPGFITGSAKGWGEVFKSTAYGLGVAGGILAEQAVISFIAPGVGNSALLARRVATILNDVKHLRNFAKVGEQIMNTSKTFNSLTNSLITSNRLIKGAEIIHKGALSSYGEAAFEADETKENLTNELKTQFKNKNGFDASGKDLEQIESIVHDAQQARFWLNIGLLSVSNTYQLGRLFKNVKAAELTADQIRRQGLKIGFEEGKSIAQDLTSPSWWNKGFLKNARINKNTVDFALEANSEGLEEFTQEWISDAINHYSSFKLDHRGVEDRNAVISAIGEGLSDNLNTKGLQNYVTGVFSGTMQQTAYALAGRGYQLAKTGQYKDTYALKKEGLQSTLNVVDGWFDEDAVYKAVNVNSVRGSLTERMGNANAASVINQAGEVVDSRNDKKQNDDLTALGFFNIASQYAAIGQGDILKKQFEFSLEKPDINIPELFPGFATKEQVVEYFNKEIDKVSDSFDSINSAFKNPFPVNDALHDTFENYYKADLANMQYRIGNLNERKANVDERLGDYYEEFKNFAMEGTIEEKGRDFLDERIETLEKDTVPNTDLIKLYNEASEKLDAYLSSTPQNAQKLVEDFYITYMDAVGNYLGTSKKNFKKTRDEILNDIHESIEITADLAHTANLLNAYTTRDGFDTFLKKYKNTVEENVPKINEKEKIEEKGGKEAVEEEAQKIVEATNAAVSPEEAKDIVINSKNEDDQKQQIEDLVTKSKSRIEIIKTIEERLLQEGLSQYSSEFYNFDKFPKKGDIDEVQVLAALEEFIVNKNNELANQSEEITNAEEPLSENKEEEIVKNGTSNLENKFENGYYNPDYFNEDGTKKNIKDDEERFNLLKSLEERYTESEIENLIAENASIDYYTTESDNVSIPLVEEIKPSKIDFYLSNPNLDGSFNVSSAKPTFTAGASLYGFQQVAGNTYEVFFIEALDSRKRLLAYKDKTIDPIFDDFSAVDFQAKSVQTVKPAIVQKQGDRYVLIEKGTIDYNGVGIERENAGKEVSNTNKINKVAKATKLKFEKVLSSSTVDAIVLNYDKIPIQTYKESLLGLVISDTSIIEEAIKEHSTKLKLNGLNEDLAFVKQALKEKPENYTYLEFLKDALINQDILKVYNLFSGKYRFLSFKGTIAEQIKIIENKAKSFIELKEYLNKPETIKDDFKFKRVYQGLKQKNISFKPNELLHNTARIKLDNGEYRNIRVAFRYTNEKIEHIDLASELESQVNELILTSFKNSGIEQLDGYYMLITDSNSTPYAVQLKSTAAKDIVTALKNDIKSLGLINKGTQDLKFILTEVDEKINIEMTWEKNGKEYKFGAKVPYEGIEVYVQRLSTRMSNGKIDWVNKKDNSDRLNEKVATNLQFVQTTDDKPTTVNQVFDTRLTYGVTREVFLTDKIVFDKIESDNLYQESIVEEKIEETFISIDGLFPETPVVETEVVKDENFYKKIIDEIDPDNNYSAAIIEESGDDGYLSTLLDELEKQGLSDEQSLKSLLYAAQGFYAVEFLSGNTMPSNFGINPELKVDEIVKMFLIANQKGIEKISERFKSGANKSVNLFQLTNDSPTTSVKESVEDEVQKLLTYCIK